MGLIASRSANTGVSLLFLIQVQMVTNLLLIVVCLHPNNALRKAEADSSCILFNSSRVSCRRDGGSRLFLVSISWQASSLLILLALAIQDQGQISSMNLVCS